MNTDALSSELLALAKAEPGDKSRSKAARLRSVLPAVEAALRAGTSHTKIVETLKAHGLDMTVPVFNTTLRRVRAAQKKDVPEASPASVEKTTPGAETVVPADQASSGRAESASTHKPSLHKPNERVDTKGLIKLGKEN